LLVCCPSIGLALPSKQVPTLSATVIILNTYPKANHVIHLHREGIGFREYFIREYCSELMTRTEMWQLCANYLAYCPTFGRDYVQQVKLPIYANKELILNADG
jgi:hypothetical protein